MLQRSPGLGALPYDAAMAKAARGYGEIGAGRVEAGIADLNEAIAWFASSRLSYTPGATRFARDWPVLRSVPCLTETGRWLIAARAARMFQHRGRQLPQGSHKAARLWRL